MKPIRVHLGLMPPMLRSMLTDLLHGEPDIMIVGNSYAGDEALRAASDDEADLLVAQEEMSAGDPCLSAIIAARPQTVFAISTQGDEGTSVNLVRRRVSLGGPDKLMFADTIRQILGAR